MKVQTANIVITSSKDAMNRFQNLGVRASSPDTNLIDEISNNKDVLLFNNKDNSNLISFNHSFGNGFDQVMTITFIDPNDEFERNFIKNLPINTVNLSKTFYVAYGIGSDITKWAGPFTLNLLDIDYIVEGSKEITLTLAPSTEFLDYSTMTSNFAVNKVTVGYSNPVHTENLRVGSSPQNSKKLYNPVENNEIQKPKNYSKFLKNEEKLLKSAGYVKLIKLFKELDFHTLVVDAFRDYLSKVFKNKNIIVLLPDLNVLCASMLDLHRESDLPYSRITSEGFIAFLQNALAHLTLSSKTYSKASFLTGVDNEQLVPAGVYSFINILNDLNNSLAGTPLIELNTGDKKENQKNAIRATLRASFYSDYKDRSDYLRIKKFIEGIQSCSYSTYNIQPVCFTESNSNLIDYWINLSKDYHIFGGYDSFDDTNNVLVFGDYQLVNDFLYHKSNILKKTEAESIPFYEPYDEIRRYANSLLFKKEEIPPKHYSAFIPMHPIDRAYLDDDKYSDDLTDILYNKKRNRDPFGTTDSFPSNFGFGLFTDEQKSIIEEEGIPIFKYNTSNPNIETLTFHNKGIYATQLRTSYQNTIQRTQTSQASGKIINLSKDYKVTDSYKAVSYLIQQGYSHGLKEDQKKEIIQGLYSSLDPTEIQKMYESPEKFVEKALNEIEQLEKNPTSYYQLKQYVPGTDFSIFTDFMQNLYKTSRMMTIKTLPLFNVTKTPALTENCVVLAQTAPLVGKSKKESNLLNTFFSGIYTITGFNHEISPTNVYSEFYLNKYLTTSEA
jgi:hypothetical protein